MGASAFAVWPVHFGILPLRRGRQITGGGGGKDKAGKACTEKTGKTSGGNNRQAQHAQTTQAKKTHVLA